YYNNYIESYDKRRFTPLFKARFEILKNREWETVKSSTRLFDNSTATKAVFFQKVTSSNLDGTQNVKSTSGVYPLPAAERLFSLNSGELQSTEYDEEGEFEPLKKYNATSQKGFLRMVLNGSDFGHTDYAESMTIGVLKDPVQLPKSPYTPTIKSLSLDYSSTTDVNIRGEELEGTDNLHEYFHLQPFGIEKAKNLSNQTVVTQIQEEGTLYIGLKDAAPAQIQNLLFKVSEGSSDPTLELQEVIWSYLKNNVWVPFISKDILSDTTNNLLTSGIISFNLPKDINTGNTILNKDLHWIKASVLKDSDSVSKMIKVQTQALVASFIDQGNDPTHLTNSLPESTISELKVNDAAVSDITQPYSSFNGKATETSENFFQRISERLRHRNRAINIWDYEHLTLEQFPSVYKVKCLNHTKSHLTTYDELAPGHVTVVVIPNTENRNSLNSMEPSATVKELNDVQVYLDEINPTCAHLHVINPAYEQLQVVFNVMFRNGYDNGFYETELNKELQQFLSPWAFGKADIGFGGKIYKSQILKFVEDREYVDFVAFFKLFQIIDGNAHEVQIAEPCKGKSILVSNSDHVINVADTIEEACEGVGNIIKKLLILNPDTVYNTLVGTPPNEAINLNISCPSLTPPEAIEVLQADITNNSFKAKWNPPTTGVPTGYTLDVSKSAEFDLFVDGFKDKDINLVTEFDVTGLDFETTYFYRVRAYDANGETISSNMIEVYTCADTITQAVGSALVLLAEPNSFNMQWIPISGITEYVIEAATDSGFTLGLKTYDVSFDYTLGSQITIDASMTYTSGTIYYDSLKNDLDFNTTYFFRVKAKNECGVGPDSSAGTIKTSTTAPVATEETNVLFNGFTANWNPTTGATGYKLSVLKSGSSYLYYQKEAGNVTTFPVTDSQITPNTAYQYRLTAYSPDLASGLLYSADSNTINSLTIPGKTLSKNATAVEPIQFMANWEAPEWGAEGYKLWVANDVDFSDIVTGFNGLDVNNVTSFDVTDLPLDDFTYYYKLKAYNTSGDAEYSDVISVKTPVDAATVPNLHDIISFKDSYFILTWDAVAKADGYYLDVATDEKFNFIFNDIEKKDVGNITKIYINDVKSGTTYYARLRAYNLDSVSDYSITKSVTTIAVSIEPGTPRIGRPIELRDTSFYASWSETKYAQGFELDVATDSAFTTMVTG
ncbi:MAG: fibronectin type III domain-containing protein, partial [Flavobacteriales bacterium]|nr:fibronectin type III domain-containing protein [Flavobacteriales bacterium]